MYDKLMKEIEYAKKAIFKRQTLYHVYGRITMAREVNAITSDEYMQQYTNLETLDAEILLLLVDKILVGETQIIDGKRICDVKISYNYVGNIDNLTESVCRIGGAVNAEAV